ncbi:peroxiredoxin [Ferrimonas marina]|uniref:Glutathione-dependent peroxiredoxin n=1 Tax=Ferrimonas marina TaxID=299255 RepID=A0A1M5VLJ8_9GAMM|nr:peroxiredoxin [Ferrimonas marina]SHH76109.1 Peroxiredoxin [Ferrimonas marina]
MIAVGDTLPELPLAQLSGGDMSSVEADYFAGRSVLLFAVPGAFTPTCSEAHLPGYIAQADKLKAAGIDAIACVAVNDAFVMKAWGESQSAGCIDMLADGDGAFHQAMGLTMDTGGFGGVRAQRYAMLVKDGKVALLQVEAPGEFAVSSAEAMLTALST